MTITVAIKPEIEKARHVVGGRLLKLFGVADGARTHDNRNHNPYFFIFAFVDYSPIININQQLTILILVI